MLIIFYLQFSGNVEVEVEVEVEILELGAGSALWSHLV